MKKFVLLFLLCAVSAFAVTTAITTSYDDCYSACKKDCTQTTSAEKCVNICVLQCKTQPEPSLVDSSVVTETKPAVAMRITPQPYPVYSCEEKCKIDFSNCGEKSSAAYDCSGMLDQCVKNCQLQIAPQPAIAPPVVMPPDCQGRCRMIKEDCAKSKVDDASCKMKIDSCLMNCNPVEPGRPPQPACGPCPVCPQQGYSCDSECVVNYYKCKSSGVDNCGQVIVECLDQCRPILPPVLTCEEKCARTKQVCFDEKLTEQECAPKIKNCLDECSMPAGVVQPPTVIKTSVAKAEVRKPMPSVARQEVKGEVPPENIPEPVKEKSFIAKIWSSIFGG